MQQAIAGKRASTSNHRQVLHSRDPMVLYNVSKQPEMPLHPQRHILLNQSGRHGARLVPLLLRGERG